MTEDAGLVLQHVPRTRSSRVLWLLGEIGCEFRLEVAGQAADSVLGWLHPEGRPPALRDGDERMHETGAMTEWLCETRAPHLWRAPGAAGRVGWLEWLHFSETLAGQVSGAAAAEVGARDRLRRSLDLLGRWLEGSEWLLSEFSGADCQMGYSVWVASHVVRIEEHPAVAAYLRTCLTRPACCRVLGVQG